MRSKATWFTFMSSNLVHTLHDKALACSLTYPQQLCDTVNSRVTALQRTATEAPEMKEQSAVLQPVLTQPPQQSDSEIFASRSTKPHAT